MDSPLGNGLPGSLVPKAGCRGTFAKAPGDARVTSSPDICSDGSENTPARVRGGERNGAMSVIQVKARRCSSNYSRNVSGGLEFFKIRKEREKPGHLPGTGLWLASGTGSGLKPPS